MTHPASAAPTSPTSPTAVANRPATPHLAAAGPPLRQMLTDSGYVLVMFPYGIASFVLMIAGFSVGVGLLITVLGLPILTGTLYLARGLAEGERRALARVTRATDAPVRYKRAPAGSGWWRRVATPLSDGQYWLDLAHGVLALPTSIISFCFVVTWWAGGIGGITSAAWQWAIPEGDEDQGLHQLLGLPDTRLAEVGLTTAIGLILLITLPPVARGAALLRALPAHAMLFAVARLRERITGLEAERATAEAERATAQAQTAAAVSAEATALRRLERDIHDGPQQRLVRLAMDLGRAQHQLDNDPTAARETVAEALAQTRETLTELRALSRGIAPPILADRGLTAAIAALAGRSTVPVEVDTPDFGRLDPTLENAAYFVIAEALTNVAKHSRATDCIIVLQRVPDRMIIEVRDNGVGGAHLAKGHGLAGLADRVRAVGGALAVDSPEGGPTTITAELPCA